MRVAALGRTQFLYDTILALLSKGHEIGLIVTCQASPEYSRTEKDFAELATQIGCPFFISSRLADPECLSAIARSQAEIAVSVNWLTLIPPRVFDIFPRGILNAHMGDLPRYRGNACPNWAILNGETEVVLTIHQMGKELDSGPIIVQRRFPLTDQTYVGDVYAFSQPVIPELFCEAVSGLETGTLVPRPQPTDPSLAFRCFPRRPSDSRLNWQLTAEFLGRMVRASSEPFAGAHCTLEGEVLTVWRARPDRLPYDWCGIPGQVAEICRRSGEVKILTGKDVLVVQEVSFGRTRQAASKVLHSTRLRVE